LSEIGLEALKKRSLLVPNAWHKCSKKQITVIIITREAKEIDEWLAKYKYMSRARILLQLAPKKWG
jgi:hypothetical protein